MYKYNAIGAKDGWLENEEDSKNSFVECGHPPSIIDTLPAKH